MGDATTHASHGSKFLGEDLYARVKAEAAARGLSPSWLARKLMGEALDALRPADEWRLTRPRPAPAGAHVYRAPAAVFGSCLYMGCGQRPDHPSHTTADQLPRHLPEPTPSAPTTCNRCLTSLLAAGSATIHTHTFHDNTSDYLCSVCELPFEHPVHQPPPELTEPPEE